MYLPPYSPDFNPIEEAFSKVKGLVRRAEARTRDALVEAMGRALPAVSARDARGFFEHCGYPVHRFNFYEQRCNLIESAFGETRRAVRSAPRWPTA